MTIPAGGWKSDLDMSPSLLFDDTYRGPRWRYGLTARHIVYHLETPANDWIMYSERPTTEARFPFGTVEYPRELSEHETRTLRLVPLGQVTASAARGGHRGRAGCNLQMSPGRHESATTLASRPTDSVAEC